ncbi:hypothetical protein EDB19DRAFT_1830842 [Suillus lakei]|nr:hypothetical protein EDB19DRAFT_1830842 [Suillus lakei]
MSLPNISREYRTQNLKLQSATLSKPKATEVTIKIHAVSLQYRDLMVSRGNLVHSKIGTSFLVLMAQGRSLHLGKKLRGGKSEIASALTLHWIISMATSLKTSNLLDLVATSMAVLREYINVPVHSMVRIPEHLSYEEGSTLPCAALTAYNAFLGPVPLKGGDYVLVLGTGGVSIFGAQIALASARLTLGYQTGGRGVDHIIEVGGPNTMLKSCNAGDSGIPLLHGMRRAIIFRSISIGSVKQFEDMNRLLTAHKIRPVVDKVFPFEEATEAYAYLESQKHVGKVVIKLV